MNQKALRVLEYDKVIALLMEQATSDSGRELCKNLLPITDREQIEQAQRETADGLARIFRRGTLSFSGLKNPGFQMKRLEIGGTLNIEDLLMICRLLEIAKRAKSYSREVREDTPADSLDGLFADLEPADSALRRDPPLYYLFR